MSRPTKKSITKYVNELHDTIATISVSWDIWWLCNDRNTRPAYLDVLNKYSLFFLPSLHANFALVVVGLYSLYEPRNDSVNIPRRMERANETGAMTSHAICDIQSQMEQAIPIWRKMCVLRSNVFAHLSEHPDTQEAFSKAKISPNQITDLIEASTNLLNIVSKALDGSSYAFNFQATEDAIELLDLLKRIEASETGT